MKVTQYLKLEMHIYLGRKTNGQITEILSYTFINFYGHVAAYSNLETIFYRKTTARASAFVII